MEKALNNLWIGSFKLRANIAKFQAPIKLISDRIQKENRVLKPALRKKNISFADVTRGELRTGVEQKSKILACSDSVTLAGLVSIIGSQRIYNVGRNESEWLCGAIVGKARSPNEWQEAKEEIVNMGYK